MCSCSSDPDVLWKPEEHPGETLSLTAAFSSLIHLCECGIMTERWLADCVVLVQLIKSLWGSCVAKSAFQVATESLAFFSAFSTENPVYRFIYSKEKDYMWYSGMKLTLTLSRNSTY